MRLSIITINYNNAVGLQRTIDSVLSQTWTDFEWIIIDGGSTDGSRDLIEEYSTRLAYWCSERDHGIYNAMNKGVLHTRGDYLNFLNSGDVYCEPTTLSRVFGICPTADILYGDTWFRNSKGEIVDYRYPAARASVAGFLNNFCIPHHQSTFIRRTVMVSHLYDESFPVFADVEFFAYALASGSPFEKVPTPVALNQLGGISDNCSRERSREVKRAKLSGMKQLFPWWFKLVYWIIPDIPIRFKWALVRYLCLFAARKSGKSVTIC